MSILRRNVSRRSGGFSLIELMTVVAIIAVIAAIAYPSYQSQIQKSNRAQGKARLMQATQLLERFYSDNNTYYVDVSGGIAVSSTAGSTAGGFAALMHVPSGTIVYSGSNNESSSPYVVTLVTPNPNSFTVTAAPQGSQTGDTKCGSLTLTNTGVKGIVGGTGTVSSCW